MLAVSLSYSGGDEPSQHRWIEVTPDGMTASSFFLLRQSCSRTQQFQEGKTELLPVKLLKESSPKTQERGKSEGRVCLTQTECTRRQVARYPSPQRDPEAQRGPAARLHPTRRRWRTPRRCQPKRSKQVCRDEGRRGDTQCH